jgi:putative addiction module CopG family antidote
MAIELKLPPALEDFVRHQVAEGLHVSEAEVIADAVRRLAGKSHDDDEIAYLIDKSNEGLQSPLKGALDAHEVPRKVRERRAEGWAA